jgi:hypothetical protein
MNPDIDMTNLDVRHRCDNRKCINLKHLEHGTRQDNVDDMVFRNRQNSELTTSDVLEIINLHKNKKYSSIAKMYNISEKSIQSIFNGKTWSHITGIKQSDYNKRANKSPNQSNEKFIVWENKNNCWRVLICGKNKFRKHIGRFRILDEAILERDKFIANNKYLESVLC